MKESFFQLKQMRVKHQMPTQTQSPHTKSYTFDETASVTLNARKRKNEWGEQKCLEQRKQFAKEKTHNFTIGLTKNDVILFYNNIVEQLSFGRFLFPVASTTGTNAKGWERIVIERKKNEHRERMRRSEKNMLAVTLK